MACPPSTSPTLGANGAVSPQRLEERQVEVWIALTVGCGGELAARCEAIGHEALEEHRIEVCARKIDGCCVARRPRADDDLDRGQERQKDRVERKSGIVEAELTTLECILADGPWWTPFVPFTPLVVGAILGTLVEKGAAAAASGMAL